MVALPTVVTEASEIVRKARRVKPAREKKTGRSQERPNSRSSCTSVDNAAITASSAGLVLMSSDINEIIDVSTGRSPRSCDVSSSLDNRTCKKSNVQFAPMTSVQTIPCRDDYTSDDLRRIWYPHDELDEVKADFQRCLKLIVRNILVEDTVNDTMRGTESAMEEVYAALQESLRKDSPTSRTNASTMSTTPLTITTSGSKQRGKRWRTHDQVKRSVLFEQDIQRHCRSIQRPVHQPEERLRQASRRISYMSEQNAYRQAIGDRSDVQEYIRTASAATS